jgi:carbon-monoxide dehydrogenase large subunit
LHAARALGRPVKWINDRSGSFVSDQQARDSVFTAELALDDDGNFLGLRIEGLANLGAYLTTFGPLMPTLSIQKNAPSLYRTQAMAIRTRCVFTNTLPIGPYRGAGRPEGNYIMERLVDAAARETGRDPVALRRQNLIPPEAIPYRALSGLEYDSGNFPAVLDRALAEADWSGFSARQRESRASGRRRGHGLACYLEVTAAASQEMGGIRFEPDGRVTLITGTLDYGQGHATPFAQVLAERLGLDFDGIDLLQKDSDELLHGGGTGGSRSLMSSGSAIVKAAGQVIAKGGLLAARHLEAAQADIEFRSGHFGVVGTDRRVALPDLAAGYPGELDVALVEETPPSAFPNGCHVCELEIDPETGEVAVLSYVVVDDFGTLVNPLLVEGQVHGGITQGLGQALMENVGYDGEGQLLTGSMMDFALPRADQLPSFEFHSHPVPAASNPLGVKGCGEAGTTGALPAVVNALLDALAPSGVSDIDMPATPERIWRALAEARLRGQS